MVTKDAILRYLGKTVAWADDTRTLVLMDFVVGNLVAAVEEYYAVTVVVDDVVFDPTKASFNTEDSFWATLINQIIQNDGICWIISSIRYISFVVLVDFILLNVTRRGVYKQDALTIVTEDIVVKDLDRGTFTSLDSRFPILWDMMVLLNPCEVLFTFNMNTTFEILL